MAGDEEKEQMRESLEGKTNWMMQYITLNDGVKRDRQTSRALVFSSVLQQTHFPGKWRKEVSDSSSHIFLPLQFLLPLI